MPVFAHRPQYLRRRRFGNRQAQQRHTPSQRHGKRAQTAKRMADEMHRAPRAPDHRFENRRLVRHIGIESGATFDRAAIAEQAGGDTAKSVLPLRNDGPPCGARAA